MTYSYFIPGIGLKASLARAMKDAAVTESCKICDRIAAFMLHSKSDNTVKSTFLHFKSGSIFEHKNVLVLYRQSHFILCYI